MAASILSTALAACRGSDLLTSERVILWLIAEHANSKTHLAWPGQTLLRDVSGLAASTMSVGTASLVSRGMISTFRLPGKPTLYLVHPAGRDGLPPYDGDAIIAHLSDNDAYRSNADKEAACRWIAGLARSAPAEPRAMINPSDERRGRPSELIHIPPLSGSKCSDERCSTPPMSGTEPESNQKETATADHRPADLSGPADDRQVPKKAAVASLSVQEQRQAQRARWTGEPLQVRERLLAEGGREAKRLEAMLVGEAVAEIEAMQRMLRIPPAADASAIPFCAPMSGSERDLVRDRMGERS